MYSLSIEAVQSLLVEHNLLREVVIGATLQYHLNDATQLNTNIEGLTYYSGESKDNSLFFCKGINFKEEFLHEAIANGTAFFVSEDIYTTDDGIGFIVSDVKKAMAILARAFYQYPNEKLTLIGITGTKGKTTTTFLTYNMLENAFPGKVGYTSTINNFYDGKTYDRSELTTPESIDLYRMFAVAAENDIQYFVMEVSSQAYKIDRVYGIQFDYGVFLNFSPDHISKHEHPTLEDYLYCKRQLLVNSDHAIVYSGTDYFDLIYTEAKAHAKTAISYGTDEKSQIIVTSDEDDSNRFSIHDSRLNKNEKYEINLSGDFNKLNATAAALIARDLGVASETINKALIETVVPGRMELRELDNGVTVIVDFAHNYLSIKTLLEFINDEYPDSKVIAVAGGPGSRGEERLIGIGEVLSDLADIIYVTADNPDYDDPSELAHLITDHITDAESVIIENDREKAIDMAVNAAESGDVVAIMGKGSENYQIFDGQKLPYIGDNQAIDNALEKQ